MRETHRSFRRRRSAGVVLLVLALGAATAPSAAATPLPNYLSQFVLLLDWVTRAIVYVPRHDDDTGLARLAHAVAETLVEQSQRLAPPAELRDLHPHFVLVLENAERAFHYLAEGDGERADRHFAVVRDEARLMRQIQREIGVEIPELAL